MGIEDILKKHNVQESDISGISEEICEMISSKIRSERQCRSQSFCPFCMKVNNFRAVAGSYGEFSVAIKCDCGKELRVHGIRKVIVQKIEEIK